MKNKFPPTETSTLEDPLTNTASDASDASHAPLVQDLEEPRDETREEIDPIVQEYGPLLEVKEDDVTVNQIAVAKKFTVECGISFDEAAGQFRQYNTRNGVCELINDAKAKLALGAFLMDADTSLYSHLPDDEDVECKAPPFNEEEQAAMDAMMKAFYNQPTSKAIAFFELELYAKALALLKVKEQSSIEKPSRPQC